MRKNFKLVALMLVACLALACVTAFADGLPTVDFTGEENEFVFTPESTDLFSNFKGVMPGDSLEQQILIRNSSDMTVNIYLKALPVDPADAEFLSYFTLTVNNGESEIFNAPANEQGGLADDDGFGVLLGQFAAGAEITLDLSLNASLEMGDEFQNAVGTITWVFSVEEEFIPPTPTPEPSPEPSEEPSSEPSEEPSEEPSAPPAPPTGEASRFDFGVVLVALGAVIGCAVLLKKSRKRSSVEK